MMESYHSNTVNGGNGVKKYQKSTNESAAEKGKRALRTSRKMNVGKLRSRGVGLRLIGVFPSVLGFGRRGTQFGRLKLMHPAVGRGNFFMNLHHFPVSCSDTGKPASGGQLTASTLTDRSSGPVPFSMIRVASLSESRSESTRVVEERFLRADIGSVPAPTFETPSRRQKIIIQEMAAAPGSAEDRPLSLTTMRTIPGRGASVMRLLSGRPIGIRVKKADIEYAKLTTISRPAVMEESIPVTGRPKPGRPAQLADRGETQSVAPVKTGNVTTPQVREVPEASGVHTILPVVPRNRSSTIRYSIAKIAHLPRFTVRTAQLSTIFKNENAIRATISRVRLTTLLKSESDSINADNVRNGPSPLRRTPSQGIPPSDAELRHAIAEKPAQAGGRSGVAMAPSATESSAKTIYGAGVKVPEFQHRSVTDPTLDLMAITDSVYKLLESKIRIERERRGIFR
jgi:hypothetical protein